MFIKAVFFCIGEKVICTGLTLIGVRMYVLIYVSFVWRFVDVCASMFGGCFCIRFLYCVYV